MQKTNHKLYKLAMSKYATGVTIITINNNNNFLGKTVNSFAALSLNPPLVLFSLDKKSSSLNNFKKSKFLGINILSKNQKDLSNHFSMKQPVWQNVIYSLSKNNVPLIKSCISNIECEVKKLINQGDHTIFVCRVNLISVIKNKEPLIYLNSKYR